MVADKLIRAVRVHGSFLLDGRRTVVTVSIGITSLNGRRGIDAAHLLSEADQAMYQAKVAGRTRSSSTRRAPSAKPPPDGSALAERASQALAWASRAASSRAVCITLSSVTADAQPSH